jgi:GT2 family glycosyltransferase/tetratricopeptide (TPR) repeat protein
MKTSIVIATYNKLEYTQQCIESIREFTPFGVYEIIIVDNHSTDGTLAWLKEQKDIRTIINEDNLGFPKACNQGIEISVGVNILLLNNDTIVTQNWLSNLLVCLYSDDTIGAVGSVTNNISYYQKIPIEYKTIAEMQIFAAHYNQSNPAQWEERLKLVGYCMLIKKSVVNEIGFLDEQFSPGNYEDDDYSLRIRKAGYKNMLCKDTFIHHFGCTTFGDNIPKFNELLMTNKEKFINKWGFNPDVANSIQLKVVDLLDKPRSENIRVLEVGCRCGGTLLKIKSIFPNAELYGIETNQAALEVASLFIHAINGNSIEILNHFDKDYFDYIIFGDHFHELDKTQESLIAMKSYLKIDGKLLVIIPNLMHYSVIRNFIQGTASKMQLSYYTLSDINELFENSGYEDIQITGLSSPKRSEDIQFVQELSNIKDVGGSLSYDVEKFLVRAAKTGASNLILTILDELQLETDVDKSLDKLKEYKIEQIMDVIVANNQKVVGLLNQLAIYYLKRRNNDQILPFLIRAYDLDHMDANTLYNLGYVFNLLGDSKKALQYLQLIERKDDEVDQLIEEINQALNERKSADNRLKFLLRRIENDMDRENNMNQIMDLIVEGKIEVEDIIKVTTHDIIEKDKVFNLVGIQCLNNQLFDHVIPLLQASFEFNPSNQDTLYNLGFILYDLGEYNQAVYFLERLIEKNDEIERVISKIREELTR